MTLAEYDDSVGPKNKRFHESAEAVRLTKEGVIPLDEDPADNVDIESP